MLRSSLRICTRWLARPPALARSGAALRLALALAAGVGWSSAASGRELPRDVPIEITADQIVYEAATDVYVAEGAVRIFQAGRRIDADWVVFNRKTMRGIAAGRVRVEGDGQVLEARFIEFDYEGRHGRLFAARLDLGEDDFKIAAAELAQIEEDHYEAVDASFSTCRCPDDEDRLPWQINAGTADVEVGGYATARNATLDVLGVPAIWLPWIMFPVKTERASGVLLPNFKIGGRNGFEVGLPLFWAARHNVNVILTPRYLTKRGAKTELLVETVYGKRSSTEVYGSYLRDNDVAEATVRDPLAPGQRRRRDVYGQDRWAAGLDADVWLPADWRLRSDIQLVSDNEYIREFDDFRGYSKHRFLESTAFAFRHFGAGESGALVAALVYADDRQNPDYQDRDRFLLQRAPVVEAAWLPTPAERRSAVNDPDWKLKSFPHWNRSPPSGLSRNRWMP